MRPGVPLTSSGGDMTVPSAPGAVRFNWGVTGDYGV